MGAPSVHRALILVEGSKQAPAGVENANLDAVRLHTDLVQPWLLSFDEPRTATDIP